ncbi:DAK2 domain-containing protein [Georgenia satyanarayanai]|uniref:DAK2 domain-containing protein n=1 Tax=Georgenia satyanarayanai TaxID=860221 RepID=UPI002042222C|nr:DAK2 domain-containing protein [Georgenia satyanarayanai]MCM3659683.1 DAK2 domain-containing protein [Georgenia satyanarayanai]
MADTLTVLGPADVRRWFEQGLRSLLAVRRQVDVLNVFPVPDGDTGTNLVLTLAGAARAAGRLGPEADLTALTAAAARGALVGARGNSGVILSQAMRGLARAVAGRDSMDGPATAAALSAAAQDARQAVARPVEGTVLTVAAAAARAAEEAPDRSLAGVVTAAAQGAARALGDTRSQLPVLAERGVVDAGAAGYTILLEALASVVDGGAPATARAREALASLPAHGPVAHQAACALGAGVVGAEDGGQGDLEVMYVLHATAREAAALRTRLDTAGESVAVVGGSEGPGERGLWQVHVHTAEPTAVLADGAEQVCVRSLTAPPAGVVACTRLPGLVAPLAATGAVVVLHPDPAGLERGVVDAGARGILLLPCDEESAALAGRVLTDGPFLPQRVAVAATRSEPAVLAVVAEQHLGAPATERLAAADDVAGRVRTASCAVAGLEETVARLVQPGDELLTAVVGTGAASVAGRLRTAVLARAPEAEVLVLDAGVPVPELLLGAQ